MTTQHQSQSSGQNDAQPPMIHIDPQGDSALRDKLVEACQVAGRNSKLLDLSAHDFTSDVDNRAVGQQ